MLSNASRLGVLLTVIVAAGAVFAENAQPTVEAHPRPRDPWVFRCVLDERPRVVVIALSDDLWAAYDTTTCSLYKVWQGGVKFDGAVYTTVHGPQPTSTGRDWLHGPTENQWMLVEPGKRSTPTPRWLGYRFVNGQVTLRYEFIIDSQPIVVEETPEVSVDENGFVTFVRLMRSGDMPRTVRLSVSVPFVTPQNAPVTVTLNGRETRHAANDKRKFIDPPISAIAPIFINTSLYKKADNAEVMNP